MCVCAFVLLLCDVCIYAVWRMYILQIDIHVHVYTQASSGEKQMFYPGDLYELDLDVEVFAVCSSRLESHTCGGVVSYSTVTCILHTCIIATLL